MMKQLFFSILLGGTVLLFSGCAPASSFSESGLKVAATTTMLADLAREIGGNQVQIKGLMGPGVDPHLYQSSAGDIALLSEAQVIVYHGLHLEGKMGEVLQSFSQKKQVICIGEEFSPDLLLEVQENSGIYDPHIWFDVSLWQEAAVILAKGLSQADPKNQDYYQQNLKSYHRQLETLHQEIQKSLASIAPSQRILITAHDAFAYFGRAYGFEVRGLQGISTDGEAGTLDLIRLADLIAEKKIQGIFPETSVSPKAIKALQAAVASRGFQVTIGGALYSDSLGEEALGTATYLETFRENIRLIVEALTEP